MTAGLFEPEKQKELGDLINKNAVVEDDVIVFCAGRTIYTLDGFNSKQAVLKKRKNAVWSLCVHDNELLDAGDDRLVYQTLMDSYIIGRHRAINALCSHEGNLYDAGDSGEIFDTWGHKIVAERYGAVWGLASHDGILYDAGENKEIHETIDDVLVSKRNNEIYTLFSDGDKLYDGGWYDMIHGTLRGSSKNVTGLPVHSMFRYNGELYYSTEDIFRKFSDNSSAFKFSSLITDAITVPRSVLGGFV